MRPTTGCGRPYARAFRTICSASLLVGLVFIPPASADQSDTQLQQLQQQRADVLAKKARTASQVNALQADANQVTAALDTLQKNVASQRVALLSANASAQQARLAADAARDAEVNARDVLSKARAGVRTAAVNAYVDSGGNPPVVKADDIDSFARAKAYGAVATGRRTDAVDQLDAARKDLARLSRIREAASANADRRLTAAQQRAISLNLSVSQQQGFADAVSARLDANLAEAQGLGALDQKLSDEITARESALAQKLAASAPRAGPGGPITITGSGDIVTVRGIQVNKSIADNLARLLSAADGAGLHFSGGGYRSSQRQVELRRQNCSGDPYTAPSSSCHPPTARPGTSMHERGLAIDFTCNGSLLRSHSDPCWQWLSHNAASFGFYNLPSESWHWSTNGN